MKPTNRIYLLLQGPKARQVPTITGQFFDINTESFIDEQDAHWFRVMGAGGRATYNAFRQPDGEGQHTVLGLRMILRSNHWYVHEDDLDIHYALIVPPAPPWARAVIFINIAVLFAVILFNMHNRLFGHLFTWKEYMAWCVVVLVWMSGREVWEKLWKN